MFNRNNGLAFLAGLSCVAGFAPYGVYAVPVLALAVLFVLWCRAATPRVATVTGFFFGLGFFSSGISWIYVALHDYGNMPIWLAAPAMFLFAAFLSLFTALSGYLVARLVWSDIRRLTLVMPVAWVAVEWLRGMIFTGFPWLVTGYAHSDSPLAGYAPVIGVYGVSLIAAVCSGLLAMLWFERTSIRGRFALGAFACLWAMGYVLQGIAWTHTSGVPFSVTLVQGNISQSIKFDEDEQANTLDTYRRLVMQNPARLTVLPETAFPIFRDEVPQSLTEELRDHARRNGGDVLVGAFERDAAGYYNSVYAIGSSENAYDSAPPHYRKHHLVIFGEFIPLRAVFGWLINEVLHIPMGDLARGANKQAPLSVAGQRVAVDICYEDVFGEEIISSLPEATLLVNVTNDAWYGNSPAAAQHAQMSRFRAMETGRMMLRATNTGLTAIIGADGRILQQLPQHAQAVLQGQAVGYVGVTPYVRVGNWAVFLLMALMIFAARRLTLDQFRVAT